MQPFFKSTYGSIVPFKNVNSAQAGTAKLTVDIHTTSGFVMDRFTFRNLLDKETQLKNYEDYLINQYKLKELQ